jgi:hypothetical protein
MNQLQQFGIYDCRYAKPSMFWQFEEKYGIDTVKQLLQTIMTKYGQKPLTARTFIQEANALFKQDSTPIVAPLICPSAGNSPTNGDPLPCLPPDTGTAG